MNESPSRRASQQTSPRKAAAKIQDGISTYSKPSPTKKGKSPVKQERLRSAVSPTKKESPNKKEFPTEIESPTKTGSPTKRKTRAERSERAAAIAAGLSQPAMTY